MLTLTFTLILLTLCVGTLAGHTDPGPDEPLRSQRYANVDLFMKRGNSLADLNTAYTVATSANVMRTTRSIGTFGPGGYPNGIAYEYESVLFVLQGLLGYNPISTKTSFEQFRSTWLEHNLLITTRLTNTSTNWNTVTNKYDIVGEGFMSTSYIRFEDDTSDKISLLYDITDPASDLLLTATSADTAPDAICDQLIRPSCNGLPGSPRPYWADTGYIDAADCKAFMNQIPAAGICPFPTISNTTRCRRIHGMSSFPQPEIHCAHVKRDSPVCVDTCLVNCSNCHANAHCVADFFTFDTATYRCECNNGYVGDGKISCAPKACGGSCDSDNQVCESSICKASSTFNWDPTTGSSICPEDTHDAWKQSNGTDLCIPRGRCLEDKHCEAQKGRTVKCRPFGHNDYTQWDHCLCNHGYRGGLDYPCVCPDDHREVNLSGDLGKVCLSNTECTKDSHCDHNEHCTSPDQHTTIGECVPD